MWGGGPRDLRGLSGDRVAERLADLGVSQTGVSAVRDNQVDGEMFIELTDNDIKDLFNIFKDRHIVRKLLQGKCTGPPQQLPYKERTQDSDQRVDTRDAAPIHTSREAKDVGLKCETVPEDIDDDDDDKSRSEYKESSFSCYSDVTESTSGRLQMGQWYPLHGPDHGSYHGYDRTRLHQEGNRGTRTSEEIRERSVTYPNQYGRFSCSATRQVSDEDGVKSSPRLPLNEFLRTIPQMSPPETPPDSGPTPPGLPPSGGRPPPPSGGLHFLSSESMPTPSLPINRFAHYSVVELLSRKTKQGKPNEAQRFGMMVIREASSQAGIWEEAPCLQLITDKQKLNFFQHAISMAPKLVDNRDLLWKRLGEALLNRRKYLRDKVLGKRGRRSVGERTMQDADLDCGSPESVERFDDQVPDTSSLLPHGLAVRDPVSRNRMWVSSTATREDPVDVFQPDSPGEEGEEEDGEDGEEDRQTYPDSTMDVHSSDSESEGGHLRIEPSRTSSLHNSQSFPRHSLNLSLLSSAACSALLKEQEAFTSKRAHDKHRHPSTESTNEPRVKIEPPQDIEKVNLHKRLFTSKYESPTKQPRRSSETIPNDDDTRRHTANALDSVPTELGVFRVAQHHSSTSSPPLPKHVPMWDSLDSILDMRLYGTVDSGISNYTGEELLARKSKQGKPSEPQRLGQQVIRESAMIAKLWQDVPDSIKAISNEQKRIFFQCAFTMAPSLVACRDLLWRRLGEALQNRRKYVRDRSLGKRPTKRETRLMNESLGQQEDAESDSQTSLSSIQDIQNAVGRVAVKQEHLQE